MSRGLWFFPLAVAAVFVACGSFDDGADGPGDAGVEASNEASSDAPPTLDGGPVGADADASSCPCPGRPPCGVPLDSTNGAFCIDPHEVSEGDYEAFITANMGKALDPGAPCTPILVTSRAPSDPNLPATLVSFCEARAYCTWAGKRLCGHVIGRPLDGGVESSAREENAWLKACAGDGTPLVLSGVCRKGLSSDAGPAPVGTTCEGSFPGVFDLQGNVWEWVDAPSFNEAGAPSSLFLGGMWAGPTADKCSVSGAFITSLLPDVGFRCCSP